jgi:hypothetical protein
VLYTQPAQSPDLNFNDLRFFRMSPKDSIELIEMVEDVYMNYPMESVNRIWLTLQSVMNRIIEER